MMSLRDIKIRSARKWKGSKIVPADGDQSKSKGNVKGMINEMILLLEKRDILFETHTFNILQKYDSKCTTSLHPFLKFRYNQKTAMALVCHDCMKNDISVSNIISAAEIPIFFEKTLFMYGHGSFSTLFIRDDILGRLKTSINPGIQNNIIELVAPSPFGTNYIELKQNTEEWENIRKNKINASRLAYVLGLHGEKTFTEYWNIVKKGYHENERINNSNIENFKRGQFFQKFALDLFEKESHCQSKRCGFYLHPDDERYGASHDALGIADIILEIKTRAKNCSSPLQSLKGKGSYFL